MKGFEGLIFEGADLDDTGVVDKHVDTAEVIDGVLNETGGLGGVGEIRADEQDVVGRADSPKVQEGLASGGELVVVTRGEDELCPGAAITLSESEAEST